MCPPAIADVIKRVIMGYRVETAEQGVVLNNVGYRQLLRTDKRTTFSWEARIANYSVHNFGMTEVAFEFLNARGWILFTDKAMAYLLPKRAMSVGNKVSMINALAVEVEFSNVVLSCESPEPEQKPKPPIRLR